MSWAPSWVAVNKKSPGEGGTSTYDIDQQHVIEWMAAKEMASSGLASVDQGVIMI